MDYTIVRRAIGATLVAATALTAACSGAERARKGYLESGDSYFSQQKYGQALIEYQNAVEADPASGEARRALGETYFKTGQPERGFKEYMRAADLLPDRADVQVRAGNLLLLGGLFEDAKRRAEQVLAKSPKDVAAQVLLGNSLAGLQDVEGAFAQIEEALAIDPENSPAHASLATLELNRGNRQKAEQAFLQAIKASPNASMPHLALGNFYWSTGDAARAETHLFQAASLDPKATMPRRALALLYLTTGRAPQAETHLQDLARLSPGVESTILLADYYALLGKPERAEETLLELERTKGQLLLTRLRLARLHYEIADKSAATKIVEGILKEQPNQYDALLLQARWLLVEGRPAEALMRARAAAAARPKSASAHFLVGSALAARGQNDAAIDEFLEVLKLNPRATPARVEMARIYMEEGATTDAVRIAEDALRIDPQSPAAQLAHARALVMQRDFKRANIAVASLVASQPRAAAVQALLGSLHMLKNDPRAARAAFERAAMLDPNSPEAIAGLVQIDVTSGRTREARARIDAQYAKNAKSPMFLTVAAATYMADGAYPQAEKALRTLVDLSPTNMEAYEMLGRLYVSRDPSTTGFQELLNSAKTDKASIGAATMAAMLVQAKGTEADARALYLRILKRNPRAAIAANNLAWLYASTGQDMEEALRLAKTAYEELPNRPEVADTLGWIYLEKGFPTLAVVPLERSVARAPKNPLYQFHLGRAYADTRQYDRARETFQRALTLEPTDAQAKDIRAALGALPAAGGTSQTNGEK